MRVFKHRDDIDMVKVIAGEMVNIEAGNYLYDDGTLVKCKKGQKPELYPSIECNGTTTTMKSNIGFIYLPSNIDMNGFAESLNTEIMLKDKMHKQLTGFARVERYAGHFTAMKAKPTFTESNVAKIGLTIKTKTIRTIVVNTSQTNLNQVIGNTRFTWFLFPHTVLMKNIQQFENPRFSSLTQFVSIYYDKHDQLLVEHNIKLEDNITFEHFRLCQNLLSFNILEKVVKNSKPQTKKTYTKKEKEERAALKLEKKCPDCKRQFKTKGSVTRHINGGKCVGGNVVKEVKKVLAVAKCPACGCNCSGAVGLRAHIGNCFQARTKKVDMTNIIQQAGKEALEQFKEMDLDDKKVRLKELSRHPEYLPQWNDVVYDDEHGIAFCPKRGTAFEIIRYFGDWESYKALFESNRVPIVELTSPVFEEDYRNVIIDNELHSKDIMTKMADLPHLINFSRDDICVKCLTPAYDDMYVVVPDGSEIHGFMVCPTCMHLSENFKPAANSTVLRIVYPVARETLIELMDVRVEKQQMLVRATLGSYIDVNATNKPSALYLGYQAGGKFKYMGWSSNIIALIEYAGGDAAVYNTGDKKKISNMIQKSEIFPVKFIEYK